MNNQQDRALKQSLDKLQRASVEVKNAEEKSRRAREAFDAALLAHLKNFK